MNKPSSLLAAVLMAFTLGAIPAAAQEEGASSHASPTIVKQPWTFAGVFGTYDEHQLQRGFMIFKDVCSGCHAARLLAFRNLSEHGGPGFTEGQVKALAAEYDIADPEAEGGTRKGVAADRWPTQMSEADAVAAFGIVPPDFSVIAKARGISESFPANIWNYITAYSEGGPDYIYALLTGYEETPPAGSEIPEGKYYNHVFPGHAIGMSPPLADGTVSYENDANGNPIPATLDQSARDVSAFLMWVAEPHLVARKEAGFRVILFLILFAGLMWFVKEKLWAPIHHHPKDEKTAA
jgi:ubiquinol-cytochrome c reductase cytochrome c1 subunit